MKCRFCSDAAITTCGFMLTEPRIGFPDELKHGDLIQSYRDLNYYMVERIDGPRNSGWGPAFSVWLSGKQNRGRTEFLTASLPLLVVRHELCAAPVCDVHQIDRGDSKPICPYHWQIVEVPHETALEPEPAHARGGTRRGAPVPA